MSNVTKVGAKMSRTKQRANRKNDSNLSIAVDDEEAMFGCVTKILGNRQFLVTIWDSASNKQIVDIRATIPKKKVRIDVNDIVNVAGSGKEWQIQAQLDSKTVNKLKKDGRIKDSILRLAQNTKEEDNDVGIEFVHDEEEEDESEATASQDKKREKVSKKGTERVSMLQAALEKDEDDNEDVDVDNI
jgi:translation initiation factor IF-1